MQEKNGFIGVDLFTLHIMTIISLMDQHNRISLPKNVAIYLGGVGGNTVWKSLLSCFGSEKYRFDQQYAVIVFRIHLKMSIAKVVVHFVRVLTTSYNFKMLTENSRAFNILSF